MKSYTKCTIKIKGKSKILSYFGLGLVYITDTDRKLWWWCSCDRRHGARDTRACTGRCTGDSGIRLVWRCKTRCKTRSPSPPGRSSSSSASRDFRKSLNRSEPCWGERTHKDWSSRYRHILHMYGAHPQSECVRRVRGVDNGNWKGPDPSPKICRIVQSMFWPPKMLHFHSKLCWITLQFHDRVISKMEGKTNFSRRLKQFDGLTWLAPTHLFYDRSVPLSRI